MTERLLRLSATNWCPAWRVIVLLPFIRYAISRVQLIGMILALADCPPDFARSMGSLTGPRRCVRDAFTNAQSSLDRSVRIGRPRGLTALPEAHSGPAFATLAGLAFYAASDPVDLRAIAPTQQTVHRAKGMEFDKVVLTDVGSSSPSEKARLLAMDDTERSDAELRKRSLTYVAATRARDELAIVERR